MKKLLFFMIFIFLHNPETLASGLSGRGYSVVSEITNNYNSQKTCSSGNTNAAYECTGVLFHGTPSSSSGSFWTATPDEHTLGGMSFMYLRTDYGFEEVYNSFDKGYIIYPLDNKSNSSISIDISCAFPLQANTAQRDSKGCGQHADYPQESLPCQSQGITTAQQWYSHFTSVPEEEHQSHQCGFTMTSSSDFDQVIQGAALAGTEAAGTYNELMVPTWSDNTSVETLPLQAIFYINDAGLKYAQTDQAYYQDITNAFLPIIKLTMPTANSKAVFSYSDNDQVVTDVASVLNAQYLDTRNHCGSSERPAYLCSGITFRATDPSKAEPWKPDDKNISSGGTSFSYARKDAKYTKIAYGRANGYIMYPQDDRSTDQLQIDVLCAYPIDASTDNRDDAGCGKTNNGSTNSEECQFQNIFTADQWYSNYIEGNKSHENQCGFIVSMNATYNKGYDVTDAFNQMLQGMALIPDESITEQNELRLQTWGADDATLAKLPLQSFFYVDGSAGLANAQKDQQQYYTEYNIVIPVVNMKLPEDASGDISFSYNESDQAVTDNSNKHPPKNHENVVAR